MEEVVTVTVIENYGFDGSSKLLVTVELAMYRRPNGAITSSFKGKGY